jgi:hypothetical protein
MHTNALRVARRSVMRARRAVPGGRPGFAVTGCHRAGAGASPSSVTVVATGVGVGTTGVTAVGVDDDARLPRANSFRHCVPQMDLVPIAQVSAGGIDGWGVRFTERKCPAGRRAGGGRAVMGVTR